METQEEVPPESVSDVLRRTIRESELSAASIAKAAHIAPAMVTRFVNRERGLGAESIDHLCIVMELKLVPTGNPIVLFAPKKGRPKKQQELNLDSSKHQQDLNLNVHDDDPDVSKHEL